MEKCDENVRDILLKTEIQPFGWDFDEMGRYVFPVRGWIPKDSHSSPIFFIYST